MFDSVWIPVASAIAALFATMLLCRRGGSMGLPLAYMANLLLIHVPGAVAYGLSGDLFPQYFIGATTLAGMQLSALASVCFVGGLWLARRKVASARSQESLHIDPTFVTFCLAGGWLFAFGLTPLKDVASVGAVIVFGSSIWMVGVILGIDQALYRRRPGKLLLWMGALLVYPAAILLFGGFLSYGTAAVIVVMSFVVVRTRTSWLALVLAPLLCFVGISLFVNYFEQRTALRSVLWSEAHLDERVDAVEKTFSGFKLFDPYDRAHIEALAERLNQNAFVGLAAQRLDRGAVEYLDGRSFYEGLESLVPRAIWPNKPVYGGSRRPGYGGSPEVVAEVTGLDLSTGTSWGVGNVLEFYINFGYWSLTIGFILLGWVIGRLDVLAYRRMFDGFPSDSLVYILPGIALIQPAGSLVEIAGGAASALIAAVGWKFAWNAVLRKRHLRLARIRPGAVNHASSALRPGSG